MSLALPRGWLILFYTKGKQSGAAEKSIPKNINEDLKSRTIFKIEKSSVDENKLVLTINRQPIGEWFKEQWEKLRHGLRQSAEEPRKNRGFKL